MAVLSKKKLQKQRDNYHHKHRIARTYHYWLGVRQHIEKNMWFGGINSCGGMVSEYYGISHLLRAHSAIEAVILVDKHINNEA